MRAKNGKLCTAQNARHETEQLILYPRYTTRKYMTHSSLVHLRAMGKRRNIRTEGRRVLQGVPRSLALGNNVDPQMMGGQTCTPVVVVRTKVSGPRCPRIGVQRTTGCLTSTFRPSWMIVDKQKNCSLRCLCMWADDQRAECPEGGRFPLLVSAPARAAMVRYCAEGTGVAIAR